MPQKMKRIVNNTRLGVGGGGEMGTSPNAAADRSTHLMCLSMPCPI